MARSAAHRAAQRATAAQLGGPTEKVFQGQVLSYARLTGWLVYHTWLSARSAAGYPDLVMLRGPRCVVAELKRLGGRLTPAQAAWLDAWRAVPGVEVFLWTPSEDCWRQIETVLR